MPDPPSAGRRYTFLARWREELLCTAPEGAFVLELTMGALRVYLPTEDRWKALAPEWAREDWPVLRSELEAWCAEKKIPLAVDETALIFGQGRTGT